MPGGPNTFPSSTLTLGTLQDADTPSLLDIRHIVNALSQRGQGPMADALYQIQTAIDNIQQTMRSASPDLQYLQIDYADIGVLAVGGQYGPGEFSVLNGAPDFANIGWIGSRAKDTSVSLTSIVGGLVTSAAAHQLKVGDNVYIEATTDPNNTGFYVVTTAPMSTTYTVTGGVAGGNSTGGTMTKQFQGEWVKMFACGGTAFDNAPFQVDVDGSLSITNATITLTSSVGEILIDPTIPAIIVQDAASNIWAELEVISEAAKAISAATNASPVVVTINAHAYVNGDTVIVAGATGNTAINGYRIVENVTANTFTMTDLAGAAINGNGVFSGPATATRYYGGGLFRGIAVGDSWSNYKLRAFADGSLKIKDATITLTGTQATISMDPTLGQISVLGTGGGAVETIISAQTVGGTLGGLIVRNPSFPSSKYMLIGSAGMVMNDGGILGHFGLVDPTGIYVSDGGTGNAGNYTANGADAPAYAVSGVAGITVTRNAGTSLTVNTALAVTGTPGVGQASGLFVTGVTLSTTPLVHTHGLLTA